MEGKGKGNPGCLRIALGCGKAGIRNADYDICLYGISGCQCSAAPDAGFVGGNAVQMAVQPGKVNIFENAVGMLFLAQACVGFDALAGYCHDLTGKDIPDKFCIDGRKRTAFRGDDVGILSFSDAERF